MKKLLLVISAVLVLVACKSKKTTGEIRTEDSMWAESLRVIPPPASDNPHFDSLKHELDKKRREKKK